MVGVYTRSNNLDYELYYQVHLRSVRIVVLKMVSNTLAITINELDTIIE